MKKLLIVLFSLLLLTACAGTKTVTDKAEAKKSDAKAEKKADKEEVR